MAVSPEELARIQAEAAEAKAKLEALTAQKSTVDLIEDDDPTNSEALVIGNFKDADPESLKAAFKKVQHESKNHRLKARDYREKLEAETAAKAALQAKVEEFENAKLLSEKNYQQITANQSTKIQQLQQVAINAAIKTRAIQEGIPDVVLNSLNRTGIGITNEGDVTGLDLAFERLKLESAEVLEALALSKQIKEGKLKPGAKAEEAEDPAAEEVDPKLAALDKMQKPGTNMTYGEYRRRTSFGSGAGADPKGAKPNAGKAQPDFKNMSSQEVEAWYQKQYRPTLK